MLAILLLGQVRTDCCSLLYCSLGKDSAVGRGSPTHIEVGRTTEPEESFQRSEKRLLVVKEQTYLMSRA